MMFPPPSSLLSLSLPCGLHQVAPCDEPATHDLRGEPATHDLLSLTHTPSPLQPTGPADKLSTYYSQISAGYLTLVDLEKRWDQYVAAGDGDVIRRRLGTVGSKSPLHNILKVWLPPSPNHSPRSPKAQATVLAILQLMKAVEVSSSVFVLGWGTSIPPACL